MSTNFHKMYILLVLVFMCHQFVYSLDPLSNGSSNTFQGISVSPSEDEIHSTTPASNTDEDNGPLSFLDDMLIKYDKRAWPTYGTGKPTAVSVNMYVNSLGSINAANMEFSMDIYLRQSWVDPRLGLTRFGINNTVTLNGQDIIDDIWKPDLFFRNLKTAKFHMVTVPNKLIKLSPDGTVLFSMRLTLRLSCHMTFRHYPLDTQRCWVVLGTYAQTMDQVVISWQKDHPITIEQEMELPEFDMIAQPPGSFKREIDTGAFSFLNVSFLFVRQNGYHLVQTYLPTFLIVMISWVSFWLHVDATPARVTLGVTTLLTLTTVASGIRTQLPPVSYVKAIDVWIGACSVMVFGALLEFTLVNYLSRRKVRTSEQKATLKMFSKSRQVLEFYKGDASTDCKNQAENLECTEEEKKANLKRALTVDRICRILFPVIFLVFNIAYWSYYLHVSQYVVI
uniref:Putative Cys-loop channel protein n=1 Tax=Cupiennius salei TaxID=6928 RepID=A0A061QLN6_CUPSA